ncbi:hypothetical protein AHF37_04618 [Paragonimus kellicotti]|nr:hypothetical protein AHF37_04618 [Paragonimus kellicotti]
MLESMLPQTVQNNQLSFGSILKKRSLTLEDEQLQQELNQLFIAQLLDEVISNALYEWELRKSTKTSDDDESDDESDREVQRRLQEINEQFARIPLPSNRDSRVTFSSHLISVDQFAECLETTVDSPTVCAPVCKTVRIPHVSMDIGPTSDFRSGDRVDANAILPVNLTVSFNVANGARQFRIVQYKPRCKDPSDESSINQEDHHTNRLTNGSEATPHVDSSGDIGSPSIVANHDKAAQSNSPTKNCPLKKSHSNTTIQRAVPSTTKHKGPIWSGDSSRPRTKDTERNVNSTGSVDVSINDDTYTYIYNSCYLLPQLSQVSIWLRTMRGIISDLSTIYSNKPVVNFDSLIWLRKKAREREQQIKEARERLHVTRQLMRRSKRSAKISAVISQAQVYRLLQSDNNLHTRFLAQG